MKRIKLFFACLLMAILSIGQVWATNAAVDDVLWSEDFSGFLENNTLTDENPSSGSSSTSTTVWGGGSVSYSYTGTTKLWNEKLAGGDAPEILINKSSKIWKISGIPTGGATEMALTFISNKTTFSVSVSSDALAVSGSQKSWTISVKENENTPETFDLTITNTGSQNARVDDVSLIVVTAAAGGDPGSTKTDVTDEQLSWSAASATVTYGETPYSLPSLTNTESLAVTYQSTNTAVATISNTGEVSILKAGSATIKAIYAGSETLNSKTVSYTLTVNAAPLTSMDEIFAAATTAGGTATDVTVTFNNWVVTGVKNSNVYVTDGTKGFIIYASNHGFAVGNILSGTASCKVQLYKGAAELTNLTSSTTGLTVNTGGTVTLNELDAEAIENLSAVNTGSLIKISGELTKTDSKYYINEVQLYGSIYSFTFTDASDLGKTFECTGIYVYFKNSANVDAINEILPRSSADIVEIVPAGAPEFYPTSKKFFGSIDVTLSEESGQDIYYTDDENVKDNPSASTWTKYTGAITVTETKTIYAAAWSGTEWSEPSDATYTLAEPLTTMADVQAEGTGSEKTIDVTITNWVVTGVSGGQAWIADADNTKGILLYKNDNGFTAGNKLNGTVLDTKIKKYNNYPELTSLVASDVTVTTAETITPRTTTIADLTAGHPAEQGTIVKLENVTYNGTNFSDGTNTISLDTRWYGPTLNSGKKYNLTGVVFYGSNVSNIKLMPRSADDVEELASMELTSIELSGTYPTTFETGDAFSHEGMTVTAHYDGADDATVTASAEFSGYDMSIADSYEVTVSYTEGEITKTAKYNITVSDPAPTGDFEELDGELVAGDYLIYEGGSLMLAEISSSRFAYDEQEPDANGIISNPSQYAVWTLAKSGDYWTFYNAKAGKYAAATGASGKAQLLDGDSDDKAKWAIDDDLVVTNKYNTENNVNATLRHNFSGTSNYGFASYGANTGAKPVFYKRATPSYYISETLTGCSAAEGNATKVPQALTEDVVLKYNLTTGYVWPDAITVTVGETTLSAADVDYLWDTSVSPAELTIDYTKVNGNIAVSITAIEKELDNITIAQAPAKVAYETGEFFNPAGLQISLNYNAGGSDVVIYNDDTKADFTFSPELETALTVDDDKVVVTYGGQSVNQAITVTDPVLETKTVVIIAEFDSKFYAMSNAVANSQCVAIEVTKNGDNLVVSSDEDKAAIQWYMSKLGSTVNLQEADENGKYLSGNSSNASFAESDDKVDLTMTQADGKYIISAGGARAIMYRSTGVFKHYATSSSESEYAKVSEIFEVADGATNIEVVVPVVYEFTIDPDEDVAFGTVEQGDDVAAKSFDVTLTNITSATVELSDNAAFSIDVTALTANGTITVTPNTENAGNFSATITLSDDDDLAEDKVINVTMKVVAPKDCDREDDFSTVGANSSYTTRNSTDGWNAVNTAVITGEDITYWMISGGTDEVGVITSPEFNYGIGKLSFDYKYTFSESNGVSFKVEIKQNGTLVAGKSYTITNATAQQNTVYSETIENINVEGKFQIVITNLSPSNKTGHKDRFAIGNLCWKKYGDPSYETVRADLAANHYYTVCFDKKMEEVQGATFWSFASRDANMAYLVEEEAPFEAGKPYIIYAEQAGSLTAILEGDAVSTVVSNGALHGTFNPMDQEALTDAGDNIYLLMNNQLRKVSGQSGNTLPAHRAYINLDEIEEAGEPAPAPGRRVRALPMQKDVATGIEDVQGDNVQNTKVLINGQLFILRGEKMYDATGRLVK